MTAIIAWHGKESIKAEAMERLREHRRRNQIQQCGLYCDDATASGDIFGCLTKEYYSHAVAERLFGIEERICHWLEVVFENLPEDKCAAWVIDSTEAIPVGADLSRCHHHFFAWLLGKSGLLTIVECNRKEINRVRLLNERAASGETVTDREWCTAMSAACDAEKAAMSGMDMLPSEYSTLPMMSARVVSRPSNWSAGWSAKAAAMSAANSSVLSVAESAVRAAKACPLREQHAWRTMAAKSIEIFRSAPIVTSTI